MPMVMPWISYAQNSSIVSFMRESTASARLLDQLEERKIRGRQIPIWVLLMLSSGETFLSSSWRLTQESYCRLFENSLIKH
jgi:hypothetical protein